MWEGDNEVLPKVRLRVVDLSGNSLSALPEAFALSVARADLIDLKGKKPFPLE